MVGGRLTIGPIFWAAWVTSILLTTSSMISTTMAFVPATAFSRVAIASANQRWVVDTNENTKLNSFFGGGGGGGKGKGPTPKQTPTVDKSTMRPIITDKRRKQLGIPDGEDEYDLGMALRNNTDDTISKIIAGSLIVAILALLVAGIVIPATTDYGEGVCQPLLSGGRC